MLKSFTNQSRGAFCFQFVESIIDLFRLLLAEISALFCSGYKRPLLRAVWLCLVFPVLSVLQLIHIVCFLFDELFYPQVRKLHIESPVFVLGPPRSGTTHMHRLLAESSVEFSTSPAWEVLLAPSILQKKFLYGLGRLDAKAGGFLRKGFQWAEKKWLSAFSETHPGSLLDPEEDYFYLGPVLACTGWMLAFPAWDGFRAFLPGCAEVSDSKRRGALHFYRICLQKQLYVHGARKTLLSKNASFSSWLDLLPDYFPNAKYIICMRSPLEAVPSMLSTSDQAMKGFFAEQKKTEMHGQLLQAMRAHYQVLDQHIPQWPDEKVFVVGNREMKESLPAVMKALDEKLHIGYGTSFTRKLEAIGQNARSYQSRHHYSLEDYNLNPEELSAHYPVLKTSMESAI